MSQLRGNARKKVSTLDCTPPLDNMLVVDDPNAKWLAEK